MSVDLAHYEILRAKVSKGGISGDSKITDGTSMLLHDI